MTNRAATPAQTSELLTAVHDFMVLALGDPEAAGEPGTAGNLKPYLQQLEHVGGLAGELGYVGIQTLCLLFQDHLESLYWMDGSVSYRLRDALNNWPTLVICYLILPPESGALDAIVRHLRLPFWTTHFSDKDIAVFQGLLRIERPQAPEIPALPSSGSSKAIPASLKQSEQVPDVIPISDTPPEEAIPPVTALTPLPRETAQVSGFSSASPGKPTEGSMVPSASYAVHRNGSDPRRTVR